MPRKIISSDDVQAVSRAAAPPELNEGGDFSAADIQVVQPDRMNVKAKEAKFMNELIEIEIEPGVKENDPLYVQLGHNGVMQTVLRGRPMAVKRKYVYSGLMAKQVSFACDFRRAGDTEINKLTPSVAGALRISLINDPNPQGGTRWFKSVMSEATGVQA